MILVTGATGNVGREVVAALARARRGRPRRGARSRARATLPAGVERVRRRPRAARSRSTPALDGARAVFLLGGWSDMPGLLRRIERAGVERVVLLTSRCVVGGRRGQPGDAHVDGLRGGGARLRASPWTVLRPSGYQSNALRWLPQLRTGDVVRAPWPDVAIAAIDPPTSRAVAADRPDRARARRARRTR